MLSIFVIFVVAFVDIVLAMKSVFVDEMQVFATDTTAVPNGFIIISVIFFTKEMLEYLNKRNN